MFFKIEKKIEGALGRAGVIETAHGKIHTPAFSPVGTKATVKALTPEMIQSLGAEVVLANTYHLYLEPGDELVRDAGGVGKFMNWSLPTITDSGGFQVFSLGVAYGKEISKVVKTTDPSLMIPERFDDSRAPSLAKIGEDGVSFKSHLDGSVHYITPERSIEIQHNLGADIIFAFDECTSPSENRKYQEEALSRTHRWAKRSLEAHQKLIHERLADLEKISPQKSAHSQVLGFPSPLDNLGARPDHSPEQIFGAPALFGIVQGGRDEELRKMSAKIISEMSVNSGVDPATGEARFTGFDGFGIGGSFAKEDMSTAVKWVNAILPEDKPRHLLGIGEPEDIFMGVEEGVDMFDCVAPTRNARNGTLYTKYGKINILNAKYKNDFSPIEEACECYVCKGYSRAYVAHLFRGKEMLAGTLASIHNLYFIVNLMKNIRASILEERFFEFKKSFLSLYKK